MIGKTMMIHGGINVKGHLLNELFIIDFGRILVYKI